MTRRNTRQCAACHTRPVTTTTLCTPCRTGIERDLGDIGALVEDVHRMYRVNDDATGTERDPVVRSRRRGKILDPDTDEEMPEPFRTGEFGRVPAMPWEADAGLGRDLDISLARQAALGVRDGPRGSGRPLPYSTRAAKVAHEASRRLDHWVRVLHRDDDPWPVNDVAAAARWLLARLGRVVTHPAAEELERDVRRVVAQLRFAVDRPADRWYAGPCDTTGCVEEHLTFDDDGRPHRETRPTTLRADPELKVVECARCHAVYDVEERRAWLLDAAQDQLAHAELIGRAAPALGVEITPAAIRGYAARGRVLAHSVDSQGRPLYRVGDVIDVARDVLARKAEARERSERKAVEKSSRRSA